MNTVGIAVAVVLGLATPLAFGADDQDQTMMQMRERMQRMDQTMGQAKKSDDPVKHRELLRDHMMQMQDGMMTMRGMMGGAGGMMAGPGGDGDKPVGRMGGPTADMMGGKMMPHAKQDETARGKGMDADQRMDRMQQRMDMMQMMMEHMMNQQSEQMRMGGGMKMQ